MQRKILYGLVTVLVAALLLVSGFAALYFYQDQQVNTQKQRYVQELDTALAGYKSLEASYNASLADYNMTLSLLVDAVSTLNTSTTAYQTASLALASLWKDYQQLAGSSGRGALVYEAHMLVDYGNGTRIWFNGTATQPGWNAYVVTLVLLNGMVEATWYPPGYFSPGQPGEHFVTGIGGVSNTRTEYWWLLTYNQSTSWQVAQIGADEIPIFNGTTFAWAFCPSSANYLPACPLP